MVDATAGGERVTCLWAHPAAEALVIEYPAVPTAGVLLGQYGLLDSSTNAARPSDVRFEVLVDGVTVSTFAAGRREVRRFRQALAPAPREPARDRSVAPLTVRVTGREVDARHFCFDLWIIEPQEARHGEPGHAGGSDER